MSRNVLFGLLVVTFVAVGSTFVTFVSTRPLRTEEDALAVANRAPLMDFDGNEFNKLRLGMTEREVMGRLGGPGYGGYRYTGTYVVYWRTNRVVISLHFSEQIGSRIDATWYGVLQCGVMLDLATGRSQPLSDLADPIWMNRWQDQFPGSVEHDKPEKEQAKGNTKGGGN